MKTQIDRNVREFALHPTSATRRLVGGLVFAMGIVVMAAGPAYANLVINGGFETGNFTGWTAIPDSTFNGVQCPGPSPVVFEGNCSAFFGPVGTTGGISQVVSSLIVGQHYGVAFALEPDGGTTSSISVSFGGANLLSLSNPPASGYHLYVFDVVATATSETLAFSFRDDPGFINLDAVAVAVPEPATLALLGISLAGLGFSRRKQ